MGLQGALTSDLCSFGAEQVVCVNLSAEKGRGQLQMIRHFLAPPALGCPARSLWEGGPCLPAGLQLRQRAPCSLGNS